MASTFIGVAGLPRAGSTLLCQLLNEHPEVYSEGHSSPLCNALLATRRFISDDPFMLSQLDVQFNETYANYKRSMQGFLHGWHADRSSKVVVDKNRAWLHCMEFLLHLDPNARLLIPIRDLGQIYGSIESQHQKTILLDFEDHLADFDRFGRADQLFGKAQVIGASLSSIQAIQDFPKEVRDRIYFIRFEDLLAHPSETMAKVYHWIGLSPHQVDTEKLTVNFNESDSHYRYKYTHRQSSSILAPKRHEIPARIHNHIRTAFSWYFDLFYEPQDK